MRIQRRRGYNYCIQVTAQRIQRRRGYNYCIQVTAQRCISAIQNMATLHRSLGFSLQGDCLPTPLAGDLVPDLCSCAPLFKFFSALPDGTSMEYQISNRGFSDFQRTYYCDFLNNVSIHVRVYIIYTLCFKKTTPFLFLQ